MRPLAVKPLFIPLRREYFEEFEKGQKDTEFRLYGPRWNERTCTPGRAVVLSRGYGKQWRLTGVITSFEKKAVLKSKGGAAFSLIYGMGAGFVAEIGIKVNKEKTNGNERIKSA